MLYELMNRDFSEYLELLPSAVEWMQSISESCLTHGRQLAPLELQDAIAVGVQHPDRIRILSVDHIADPEDPSLLQAATELGLLGDAAIGRAIGYGVEIVNGQISRRLLRHEFRHVYQFEQAGSVQQFMNSHIQSVIANGYYDSDFEKDARAFEAPDD